MPGDPTQARARKTVPVYLPLLRRLLAEHLSHKHVRDIMARVIEKPEGDVRDTPPTDEMRRRAAEIFAAQEKKAG